MVRFAFMNLNFASNEMSELQLSARSSRSKFNLYNPTAINKANLSSCQCYTLCQESCCSVKMADSLLSKEEKVWEAGWKINKSGNMNMFLTVDDACKSIRDMWRWTSHLTTQFCFISPCSGVFLPIGYVLLTHFINTTPPNDASDRLSPLIWRPREQDWPHHEETQQEALQERRKPAQVGFRLIQTTVTLVHSSGLSQNICLQWISGYF